MPSSSYFTVSMFTWTSQVALWESAMQIGSCLVSWNVDYMTGQPHYVTLQGCMSDTVVSNTEALSVHHVHFGLHIQLQALPTAEVLWRPFTSWYLLSQQWTVYIFSIVYIWDLYLTDNLFFFLILFDFTVSVTLWDYLSFEIAPCR